MYTLWFDLMKWIADITYYLLPPDGPESGPLDFIWSLWMTFSAYAHTPELQDLGYRRDLG